MYTVTILILLCIVIILLASFYKKVNFVVLAWIVSFCSLYAWIEFIYFNSFLIKAWEFSEDHIIGVELFNTALEDFLFAPILSILFYFIYNYFDIKINKKSSDILKAFNIAFLILITYFFHLFGGDFSKAQTFKMLLGLSGIAIFYKEWDLRQYWVMIIFSIAFSGSWDIWSGNCTPQQWWYKRIASLLFSDCYNSSSWWWFKIGKAHFPLSIFPYYYYTGAVFFQGSMMIIYKLYRNYKLKIKNYVCENL